MNAAVTIPVDAAPAVPRPGLGAALLPLLTLALMMAAGFTAMNSFGTVQEAAKAELGLSDTILGLVQGLSVAVPMVLLSVPIGILVDRRNRVRLTIVLGLLWTVGTLLTAVAANAPTLFVARMLTGIGTTGAVTAALSLAADLCLPQERGRAILIITMGKSLGMAGAFALTGWLLGLFIADSIPAVFGAVPWRSAHYVLAALSLIAIIPMFFLREPARREVESAPDAPFRVLMREMWARRAFLIPLFVGQTGVVMADAAATIWAAPVLGRNYALQPADFAGWMGVIMLLSVALGGVFGGALADWGQKTGRRGGVLIGAVIVAAIGVPAALFPVMPGVLGFAIAFGVLQLAGTVTGLIASVALTVLIPNELRGLCIGAFLAVAGLIGFGLAPTLVTWVSLLLGGEAQLGTALAITGVAVSAMSVAGFAFSMRHAPLSATHA